MPNPAESSQSRFSLGVDGLSARKLGMDGKLTAFPPKILMNSVSVNRSCLGVDSLCA